MFLFFYGDNIFMLERKLSELKEKYRQKAGGNLNLITFEGENIAVNDFLTQVMIMPLLASSRLIIVKNIFSCKSKNSLDQIRESIDKIPSSTIVVFTHSGKMDKRLGLYKTLSASKNAHEFPLFDLKKQASFAKREIERLGSRISGEALDLLLDYCQGDIFALFNEIEKLTLYRHQAEIQTEDIQKLVSRSVYSDVFKMVDRLSAGDRKSAFSELENLYSNNEPGLKILSMINYQYRLIAQIKDVLKTAKNPFEASRQAGVSYFQAGKVYNLAEKMTWQMLFEAYTKILKFDERIKTGKISEDEGVKELITIL